MSQIEKIRRTALEQTAEVKRILFATLHALNNREPATLLITSAAHGDGKSVLAAALAVAAAQSGKQRVAVLDLNWYRPTLHQFFEATPSHPWQAFMAGDLSDLITSSAIDALDVLTGPVDYADQASLDGQSFAIAERLIAQAKARYHLVIIDGAAIFPTNRMMMDPVMLSGMADGVVLVVLNEVTPRQQVRKAQKVMESAGANILGVIANQGTRSQSRRQP
jgi:Mrp family chromosome partitioning ATPase